MSADGRRFLHALAGLLPANLALMAVLCHRYVSDVGESVGSAAGAFATVALFAQCALAASAVAALLAAIACLPRGAAVARVLAPPAFTALVALLRVDQIVFSYFHFHVNALVLSVLATRAGRASMHVSPAELPELAAAAAALLIAEWAVLSRLLSRARSADFRLRARWAAVAAAVLAVGIADRATYAACDLAGRNDVTREASLVPGYLPLTVRRLASRLHLAVASHPPPALGRGLLRYPREPLAFQAPASTPNVLWIVLDCWRADELEPVDAPNLSALAARSQVFLDHRSGGNSTRFGIFSMFYGLDGTYWRRMLAEGTGPVLFPRLAALGYRTRILSSLDLHFPEFRSTVFRDVTSSIEDTPPGATTAKRDAALFDGLRELTAAPDPHPFFAFLLLESTHAPYDFDPATAIHEPSAPSYRRPAQDDAAGVLAVKNRYRNAVHYADSLVGKAIADLDAKGLLASTIVIVTGDHGEEFWERGYWGHNQAFTPEETRVPLILSLPGAAPAVVTRATSHADLAPTLLTLLGATSPASDYSAGHSLLDGTADPFSVTCSWDECALIDGGGVLVFGTEPYDASRFEARDAEYRLIPDRQKALAGRPAELVRVIGEMDSFLR